MNKQNLIIAFVIISSMYSITGIKGQSLADSELKTLFSTADTAHRDYTEPLREAKNEVDITISATFLFYKTFISSQDMPTCIFIPSCSEYAVQAFQKKGIIMGWLSTFDRLSRCHGLARPEHYPFDINKKRFYDPVR